MDKLRIAKRKETALSNETRSKLEVADIATIGHYTEFGFMDPRIQSTNPNMGKVFGPALTVRIPSQESKALHVAISMAQEGDVVVIDRCGDSTHAAVGEMIALCANTRKLAAIVVDGPMTDYDQITEIGIPVFATGISGLTTKFICDVGEINYDVSCGGVPVHPGDMVMADNNGVLVLRDFELDELLDSALKDQEAEAMEQKKVKDGKTLQELYVPEYPV